MILRAHNSWCKYIFIWVCQSTGPWVCFVSLCVRVSVCVRVCVCVCVRSNQSASKKQHYLSDLNKLDAFLHKYCVHPWIVATLCTSMISLSKIARQMWRDYPFTQRNMTTEWALEGVRRQQERGRCCTKLEKKRVGNIREEGLHKIGGLGPLC